MQADGVATIDARVARAVFECSSDLGDVTDGNHGVLCGLDGNAQHVPWVFNDAGHFDGEAALTVVETARRDQPVVAHDAVDNLIRRQLIGFQHRRVDDRFHQLFALARHVCGQDTRLSFDGVSKIQRDVIEHSLRNISDQVDLQNGKIGSGLLLHDGFFRIGRKLNLGAVNRLTGVQQRLIEIEVSIELHHHRTGVFRGEAVDLFYPINLAQLDLQRHDQ